MVVQREEGAMLRRIAIGQVLLALLVAPPATAQDYKKGLAAALLGLLLQGGIYKLRTKFDAANAWAA